MKIKIGYGMRNKLVLDLINILMRKKSIDNSNWHGDGDYQMFITPYITKNKEYVHCHMIAMQMLCGVGKTFYNSLRNKNYIYIDG